MLGLEPFFEFRAMWIFIIIYTYMNNYCAYRRGELCDRNSWVNAKRISYKNHELRVEANLDIGGWHISDYYLTNPGWFRKVVSLVYSRRRQQRGKPGAEAAGLRVYGLRISRVKRYQHLASLNTITFRAPNIKLHPQSLASPARMESCLLVRHSDYRLGRNY